MIHNTARVRPRVVRIRPTVRVTAVSPTLPRALAWLLEHDTDDTLDCQTVAAYWRSHATAHGEAWEGGDD